MKRPIYFIATIMIAGLLGVGCDARSGASKNVPVPESSGGVISEGEDAKKDQKIPATLDEALDLMMAGLTAENRKAIEDSGEDYATDAHFESGWGMRNDWGLWGDSPLARYFARLGIYHADDRSSIINKSFSRKVRGKDIQLEELVQYYRDYWSEQDIIAPVDLACPHCAKEMIVEHMGEGVSAAHPERVYFSGICPDEQQFLFYHKDGWRRAEALMSEKAGDGQPTVQSESRLEAAYEYGLASLTFKYPAHYVLDPKSFQGEAKWWGRVFAPDGALSIEAMSHGYCSEELHSIEGFKSPEDYVMRKVCGAEPERTKFADYDRLVSRDATTVTVVFLKHGADWGKCYQLMVFKFEEGDPFVVETINQIVGTALPSFDSKRF